MGVFSIFSKKNKVKGSPAVGGSTRRPGPAEPLVKVAYGSTRRPGPAQWTLTTASGTRTMAPVMPHIRPSKPAPAPTKVSRKVFSEKKAVSTKIPSYTKIPSFAKSYPRVPGRTFVRDLSDTNLNRTFGTAKTGTQKAKDSVAIAKKARDPFEGLPSVNLPTVGKTTTANKPTPAAAPTIKPVEISQAAAKIKEAGSAVLSSETAKKVLPYAAGIAAGAAGIGAIVHAGKEPRKVQRRQTSAIPQGAETDRRGRIERRDSEHGQTGTKYMRGRVLPGEKFGKAETDKAFSAAVEKGAAARDVARGKEVNAGLENIPPAKELLAARNKELVKRKAGTSIGKGKFKGAAKVPTAPVPASVTVANMAEKLETEDRKSQTGEFHPSVTKKPRGRPRKLSGTGTVANKAAVAQAIPKAETKPIPFAPLVSSEYASKVAQEQSSTLPKSGFVEKRKVIRREPFDPKREPGYGNRKTGGRRIGDVDKPDKPVTEDVSKKIAANDARIAEINKQLAEKEKAAAPTPPTEKPGKTYRFRHPKKSPAATGGASVSSSARKIQKLLVREEPSGGQTITQEPAVDRKRRFVRREKAMAKAETRVGTSQALSTSMTSEERAARDRLISEHIKKKGVTVLPPAGKEIMEPEVPQKDVFAAARWEAEHKGRTVGKGKLKVKAPAVAATEKPISTRDRLLAEVAKQRKINEELRKGVTSPKISTTGNIKSKAPAAVVIRSPKLPAKAETTTPKPTVSITRKAGTSIGKGKLRPGKLGVAALLGVGAGALMSGQEAKASTGSYAAAAKAAGKSLYESGREYAKFGVGATIAARMPGALGAAARFGLGKALPVVGAVASIPTIVEAGQAGMGMFRAKREAEKERKASQAKYGTVAAATATRHARRGLK